MQFKLILALKCQLPFACTVNSRLIDILIKILQIKFAMTRYILKEEHSVVILRVVYYIDWVISSSISK